MKRLLFFVVLLALGSCTKNTAKSTRDVSVGDANEVASNDVAVTDALDLQPAGKDVNQDTRDVVLHDEAKVDADVQAGDTVTDDVAVTDALDVQGDDTVSDVVRIEDITPPPDHLPFTLTRPDKGKPLTQSEIENFSYKISGLWKRINFFRWVIWTSHGMDASTGKPDYLIWWQDVNAVKTGDLVTFRHSNSGGAHNIGIPTAKVLSQAIGGYMLTGDKYAAKVAEEYCKGLTATMKGMVWDKNDPNIYLMARNIVNRNYSVTLEGGRKKAVDYTPWYNTYKTWNAQRLHYPHNPYWGDIYVTNMRSKDDVCHIFRTAAFLWYIIKQAKDPDVQSACQETLKYLKGFAKDIVDHDYHIRTKDGQGKPFIPDQDLASFVNYISVDPKSECTARLASDFLAYGVQKDKTDCGSGYGSIYEKFAVTTHYFNYAIINNFHMAAIDLALVTGNYKTARKLLLGLVERINNYMHPSKQEPGPKNDYWESDLAVLLVQAASVGLPLTSEEARLVQKYYSNSVDAYENWPRWDLWAKSVPDGTYDFRTGFRPKHTPNTVDIENIALLLEYCNSPFRNPAGVSPVDCDIIRDESRWGGPKSGD